MKKRQFNQLHQFIVRVLIEKINFDIYAPTNAAGKWPNDIESTDQL